MVQGALKGRSESGVLRSPGAIQESRSSIQGGLHRDEERTGFTSGLSLLDTLGWSKSEQDVFILFSGKRPRVLAVLSIWWFC